LCFFLASFLLYQSLAHADRISRQLGDKQCGSGINRICTSGQKCYAKTSSKSYCNTNCPLDWYCSQTIDGSTMPAAEQNNDIATSTKKLFRHNSFSHTNGGSATNKYDYHHGRNHTNGGSATKRYDHHHSRNHSNGGSATNKYDHHHSRNHSNGISATNKVFNYYTSPNKYDYQHKTNHHTGHYNSSRGTFGYKKNTATTKKHTKTKRRTTRKKYTTRKHTTRKHTTRKATTRKTSIQYNSST
jgi:hypothetical protein